MDPNATLREMRELLGELRNGEEVFIGVASGERQYDAAYHLPAKAERFVELFEGLDSWMSQGGFSPWDFREGYGGNEGGAP